MSNQDGKKPALPSKSNAVAAALPRDEKKRQDQQKKEKDKVIKNLQALTEMLIRNPSKFVKPELDFFRKFISHVSNDPVTFPLPVSYTEEHTNSIQSTNTLTNGVARKLETRYTFSNNEFPVLMIGDIDFKTKPATAKHPIYEKIYGKQIIVTAWSLDGDNHFVLLQFDYTLSSKMQENIRTGSVIRVTHYVPVYFNYNDKSDLRVAILVRNFQFLEQKRLSDDFVGRPADGFKRTVQSLNHLDRNNDSNQQNSLSTTNINNTTTHISNNTNINETNVNVNNGTDGSNTNIAKAPTTSNNTIGNDTTTAAPNEYKNNCSSTYNSNNDNIMNSSNNFNDTDGSIANVAKASMKRNSNYDDDDYQAINIGNNDSNNNSHNNNVTNTNHNIPDCDGEQCSVYNTHFSQCVVSLVPVDSIILHEAARECFFVTVDISEMNNKWKRNILYYWYATNIYGISGKGNRQDLPRCVVQAIRNLYPELNIHDYTTNGHATKKQRN